MADEVKRNAYNVSQEQFATLWRDASTADEAVDAFSKLAGTKVKKAVVLSRAAVYRKRGVHLKKMPRVNPRKLNVEKLNAMLDKPAESEAS
jgi:hypothetical protein